MTAVARPDDRGADRGHRSGWRPTRPHPRVRRSRRRRVALRRDPRRPGDGARRRQRLRQVDPAARAGPTAQAGDGPGAARREGDPHAAERARSPGPSGCSRRPRSRRTASPSSTSSAGAGTRTVRLPAWSAADEEAVTEALTLTDTLDLAARPVDELSGGQRQRVWLAMALPRAPTCCCSTSRRPTSTSPTRSRSSTCSLDLNRSAGTTIVMVLHDLGLAARYADHLVVMRQGRVHRARDVPGRGGDRGDGPRCLRAVDCRVVPDPVVGHPAHGPRRQHLRARHGRSRRRDPGPRSRWSPSHVCPRPSCGSSSAGPLSPSSVSTARSTTSGSSSSSRATTADCRLRPSAGSTGGTPGSPSPRTSGDTCGRTPSARVSRARARRPASSSTSCCTSRPGRPARPRPGRPERGRATRSS